ncbi:hypothetical protein EMIHUDRAFT_225668 [Emiliania huxleyi CCMP1516]|uniref:Uncharacterized protein n=2 Tax=Emiliania huxleyi TaxID=2903 RepID=A0A0D3KNA9_EMIH1|nr:hypothetical protein EMIHUDRAFT_225668 [Emiliania huxleyi CCMP1516]EOD37244.1 hypothetical protein EMIHUDRAFT_225668 [Emiliania huxleyi CCMP1516]|eukprot:XP_005789673.1 hypothetical protein EMIHUDRAFT_225668 [Emiliania huxleyi CCMP1516]
MRCSSSSRSDLNSLPDTPESPKRLPEDPEPPSSGVGVPPEQLHGGDGAVVQHEGTQRTGRVSTGRSGKSKRVLRAERRLRAGAGTPPDGDRLGRVSPGGLSPGRLSGRGSPASPIESALGEVGRLWGVLRQELARETPYVPGLSIHTPKRRHGAKLPTVFEVVTEAVEMQRRQSFALRRGEASVGGGAPG